MMKIRQLMLQCPQWKQKVLVKKSAFYNNYSEVWAFQELEEAKLLEVVKLIISYESIDNRRMETIFIIFIIGFMAGPAKVSLYGSPTVSPVIAAFVSL